MNKKRMLLCLNSLLLSMVYATQAHAQNNTVEYKSCSEYEISKVDSFGHYSAETYIYEISVSQCHNQKSGNIIATLSTSGDAWDALQRTFLYQGSNHSTMTIEAVGGRLKRFFIDLKVNPKKLKFEKVSFYTKEVAGQQANIAKVSMHANLINEEKPYIKYFTAATMPELKAYTGEDCSNLVDCWLTKKETTESPVLLTVAYCHNQIPSLIHAAEYKIKSVKHPCDLTDTDLFNYR